MADAVLDVPSWVVALLLVVVMPGLVLLLQWGIRRRWPALAEGDHNEVVGFIIAVVGVIYAVLLAFVVIVAWENYDSAERIVGQEASTLRGLYRESAAFPAETREELRDLVQQYAGEVVELEWPAMSEGVPGDPRAGAVFDEMADVLAGVQVTTPAQEEFVGAEAERLSQLVGLRSQRLDYVDRTIPGVLWTALIVGGVVTIGFALLFGLQRAVLHSLMLGSLAALIGVLLFVAVEMDRPFAGGVAIEPEPFERVLVDFSG
ncbi:bestrophin-like domain [Geodermatophilus sp. URMC 61]|uniref:bestrophin-like domain n=1 Tax=Geodermatophilus sp. URMC 61 TaxID=3423411 RepID=UPI00406C89A4